MLNCKDKCEGWTNTYSEGVLGGHSTNGYQWRNCHFCGAKLVDEDFEPKEEFLFDSEDYLDDITEEEKREWICKMFSKYNITRKEEQNVKL